MTIHDSTRRGKYFSEFDLAKAIFTHQNYNLICHKAEIAYSEYDIGNGPKLVLENKDLEKFNKTRDIMWDQERKKREKAKEDAKAIYPHLREWVDISDYDYKNKEDDIESDEIEEDKANYGGVVDYKDIMGYYPSQLSDETKKALDKLIRSSQYGKLVQADIDRFCSCGESATTCDGSLIWTCHEHRSNGPNPYNKFNDKYRNSDLSTIVGTLGGKGYRQEDGTGRFDRKVKDYALGFAAILVTAGDTIFISRQLDIIFRPSRLVIPSKTHFGEIAKHFTLHYITIGPHRQPIEESGPASRFTEDQLGDILGCDTCNVGELIQMSVTNNDDKDHVFCATMFGTTIG